MKKIFTLLLLCYTFFLCSCTLSPQKKAQNAVITFLKKEVAKPLKHYQKEPNELPTNKITTNGKSYYENVAFENLEAFTLTNFKMQHFVDPKLQELIDDSVQLNLNYMQYEYLYKQHANDAKLIAGITPIKDSLKIKTDLSRRYISDFANNYIGKEIYKINHKFKAQYLDKDINNISAIFYLDKKFEVIGWDEY